jgi:hypothetical protein
MELIEKPFFSEAFIKGKKIGEGSFGEVCEALVLPLGKSFFLVKDSLSLGKLRLTSLLSLSKERRALKMIWSWKPWISGSTADSSSASSENPAAADI